jgi:hypothetical protein
MRSWTAPLLLINGVAKLLNQFLASCLCHFRFQRIDQIHIGGFSFQPDFNEFTQPGLNIFPQFSLRLIIVGAPRVAAGSCPFTHY